jgi:hypothetical protein
MDILYIAKYFTSRKLRPKEMDRGEGRRPAETAGGLCAIVLAVGANMKFLRID